MRRFVELLAGAALMPRMLLIVTACAVLGGCSASDSGDWIRARTPTLWRGFYWRNNDLAPDTRPKGGVK